MVHCVYCDSDVTCDWDKHTASEKHANNVRDWLRTNETIDLPDLPELVVITKTNYVFFWLWTILVFIAGMLVKWVLG